MRVLYLAPSGADPTELTPFSFLNEEIEGLAAKGVQPYVLSESAPEDEWRDGVRVIAVSRGSWSERARTVGFLTSHRRLLPSGWFRYLSKSFHRIRLERFAAAVVREHEIDLIHSHFGCALSLGGVLARAETGRPLVVSFRGMDLLLDGSIDYGLRNDPFYDSAVHTVLQQMDYSTYASDFMRGVGIQMGADRNTAVTIRKGVDLDHFCARCDGKALRKELKVQAPLILTVAGLIKRKGVDVILHALARLRDSHEFVFVVCGEGPEKENLRALSRELGLADRTIFAGRISREDIPRYFSAADLFLLGSHVEAAGNVLLEAMASARPIVCTDSGGPPEYVRDGATGFVVSPGDPVAMAEKIGILLEDADLRERLGATGRIEAERHHRYADMIDGYLEVYRRVLSSVSA